MVLFLLHHSVGRRVKKKHKCMIYLVVILSLLLLKGVKVHQGSISRVKPVLSESDVIAFTFFPRFLSSIYITKDSLVSYDSNVKVHRIDARPERYRKAPKDTSVMRT